MEKRALGRSGLSAAPLAFGGNVFGWTVDEPGAFALLDAFVDAGFSLVDTADIYSNWVPGHRGGESETIIGNWLARTGKRESVLLATKVGKAMGPDAKGLSKAWILRAADDSLRRLRTDRIDLYQAHEDDPETPIEETLEAFAQLIRAGKVRAIGASNYGAARLARALDIGRRGGYPLYSCLQPQYNLYDRAGYEAELEPLCRERGLGVIAYFPLAAGFLTGKYRSRGDLAKSARGGMVGNYLNDRGFRILAALDGVAGHYRVAPAAVALAWLIARPGITAPIASATSVAQLSQLLESARFSLGDDAIALLDRASA